MQKRGSSSRAAKRLHTAQSFLTKKIGEAERHLRIKIFERSTRKLELTEVGKIVVPEIELALRHAERAWELGRYYERLMRGPIRLGYSLYTHGSLLWVLHSLDLSQFEARLVASEDVPEPRIVPEHSVTSELIERVLRGKLHVSLGVFPPTGRFEQFVDLDACGGFIHADGPNCSELMYLLFAICMVAAPPPSEEG